MDYCKIVASRWKAGRITEESQKSRIRCLVLHYFANSIRLAQLAQCQHKILALWYALIILDHSIRLLTAEATRTKHVLGAATWKYTSLRPESGYLPNLPEILAQPDIKN